MDWPVILARAAIALTFLGMAIFGPWALIKLNGFIKHYAAAHRILEDRVTVLERLAGIKSTEPPGK